MFASWTWLLHVFIYTVIAVRCKPFRQATVSKQMPTRCTTILVRSIVCLWIQAYRTNVWFRLTFVFCSWRYSRGVWFMYKWNAQFWTIRAPPFHSRGTCWLRIVSSTASISPSFVSGRAELALLGSTSITSTSAMVFDSLSKTVDRASHISTGSGGMLPIGGKEDGW